MPSAQLLLSLSIDWCVQIWNTEGVHKTFEQLSVASWSVFVLAGQGHFPFDTLFYYPNVYGTPMYNAKTEIINHDSPAWYVHTQKHIWVLIFSCTFRIQSKNIPWKGQKSVCSNKFHHLEQFWTWLMFGSCVCVCICMFVRIRPRSRRRHTFKATSDTHQVAAMMCISDSDYQHRCDTTTDF